jgi:hypothetical protein
VPCQGLLVASSERPQAGRSFEDDGYGRRPGCSRSVRGHSTRDAVCDLVDDTGYRGMNREVHERQETTHACGQTMAVAGGGDDNGARREVGMMMMLM